MTTGRPASNAAYLAAIVESSDDAILSKDLNGIIQSCNASAERLFGYTAAELVGQNIRILIPPDRPNEEDAILARIRRGERVSHFETVRFTKSGRPVDVSLTISPVRDEAGTIVGASKIIRDISEQKRGRAAQAYLAALVESSEDAILSKNLDGIIQSCNATAERLFGYSAAELVGKSVRILIPPERQTEEDEILGRIHRGDRIAHFETVRVAKDGRRMDISLSISPIRDSSGTIIGASKIARDITEQKRIAAELAAQEEWFRVTLESIGDAVVACDPQGRVTYMNVPAQTLTGWRVDEAMGHPLAEVFRIVNEKTRQPVENPADLVIRSGHIVGLANHSVLIGRNGTDHPIADSAAPIRDKSGQIIGVVLVFHDVSDERAAEIAIAEQREWLQTTLASIGDAMIATDRNGRVSYMNHVAESLTVWKQDEAFGRNLQDVFTIVNELTRQPVDNPALRAIREGRIVGLANHTVLIARSGQEIPIDDSGSPIKSPDGTISGAVLIFRDITERRQVEKEREMLAEQTRMLNSGFDAIIVRDMEDRITSWNRVAENLYGWSTEETQGRNIHSLLNTTFPKSLAEIREDLDRDNKWEGELTHKRRDGSVVDVLSHWVLDRDPQGKPKSILQINVDISGRKRAEEQLREQRELLQVTLASIGDAVIATDSNGAVTFLNHVAESLTAWAAKDALGQPLPEVFRIVNEQTRKPVENPALLAMREGLILGLANSTVLIAKDGNERPIDDAGSPIRDENGKTIGAVLIFRDITQRRLLEKERESAARASRRLAAIVESSTDSIIGTDSEFRITSWNQAAERMFGYTVDEAVGQSIRLIVPEHRWDEEETVINRVHRGAEIKHFETERQRKDGTIVPVSLSVSPIYDSAGAVVGASKILRDITQQKCAAEVEAQARRAAEEANRAKDEFLAMLSHELRTPLSAVLGWVRILKAGQMPLDRADHALEIIERNTTVEVRLVDSLLDLSRITAGKLQLDSERVELPDILEAVLDSVRPAADSKNIILEITPAAGPLAIVGDSGRIQQIFWNLLTNAIKFTPSGGHISVGITHRGSHAQIQVIDDGEGIDAEFLPRVFERFRQAESGKGRSQKGLGLGLTIVRELVQAHGGTIFAESPGKGKGSTFTVMFPIPAVIPAHIEAANLSLLNPEEHSIAGLRILVVDDEADARELVGLTLQSRGAVIQLASSATEALKLISRDKPDVMIADIEMPGEDGYILIRTLRAIERGHSHKRLPAIALTAYATLADRDQALAAGYDIHLAKPVGPANLTQALSSLREK